MASMDDIIAFKVGYCNSLYVPGRSRDAANEIRFIVTRAIEKKLGQIVLYVGRYEKIMMFDVQYPRMQIPPDVTIGYSGNYIDLRIEINGIEVWGQKLSEEEYRAKKKAGVFMPVAEDVLRNKREVPARVPEVLRLPKCDEEEGL